MLVDLVEVFPMSGECGFPGCLFSGSVTFGGAIAGVRGVVSYGFGSFSIGWTG